MKKEITENGEEILIGPYTREIRDHYIAYKTGRYLIDHPGATQRQAARNARIAWRYKCKKAEARMEKSAHELQK